MRHLTFPQQVNEPAARIVAGVVAVTLLGALLGGVWWLVPVLAVGFVLRVLTGPTLSPLARVAVWVAPRVAASRLVAGPPKRFAQGVGASLTAAASLLFAVGSHAAAWGLVVVVLGFATLEAAAGFCMGCWAYGRLQRAGWVAPDTCVDCTLPQAW